MLDIIIIDEYDDDGENVPYLKISVFSCFLSDGWLVGQSIGLIWQRDLTKS